jgi:hypothetical protein
MQAFLCRPAAHAVSCMYRLDRYAYSRLTDVYAKARLTYSFGIL